MARSRTVVQKLVSRMGFQVARGQSLRDLAAAQSRHEANKRSGVRLTEGNSLSVGCGHDEGLNGAFRGRNTRGATIYQLKNVQQKDNFNSRSPQGLSSSCEQSFICLMMIGLRQEHFQSCGSENFSKHAIRTSFSGEGTVDGG